MLNLVTLINKNITYKRLKEYEDNQNASIALKVKDGKGKWIGLMCIYRQWKIPGERNALDKVGIARQLSRLKIQVENHNLENGSIKDH